MAQITIDLDEPHVFFALSDALRDWGHRLRDEANDDGPDHPSTPSRIEWADTADRLLSQIEKVQYGGVSRDPR